MLRTNERDTELQRWLNTWIALGAVVLVVTAGYLFFISNALVSIHRDLSALATQSPAPRETPRRCPPAHHSQPDARRARGRPPRHP